MWRVSKKVVVDFLTYLGGCIRASSDLNDLDNVSDAFEIEDVQVHVQPQIFRIPVEEPESQQQQCEPLQHRPDAPGIRRRSPPELVIKVRQAIEEMVVLQEKTCQNPSGDHVHLPPVSHQPEFAIDWR
ncbi:uncharacterized protein [Fopius arisanus]|uniref:Uncharacterized protein isoform X2 n=1 Tax=Fopius arisanus TaxID=64838 RepID=A0A9R1TN86_9HYME|nr:PREDICTED: uncharacterized protein LOC105272304 isoform X2 [Fopius arisanus]